MAITGTLKKLGKTTDKLMGLERDLFRLDQDNSKKKQELLELYFGKVLSNEEIFRLFSVLDGTYKEETYTSEVRMSDGAEMIDKPYSPDTNVDSTRFVGYHEDTTAQSLCFGPFGNRYLIRRKKDDSKVKLFNTDEYSQNGDNKKLSGSPVAIVLSPSYKSQTRATIFYDINEVEVPGLVKSSGGVILFDDFYSEFETAVTFAHGESLKLANKVKGDFGSESGLNDRLQGTIDRLSQLLI